MVCIVRRFVVLSKKKKKLKFRCVAEVERKKKKAYEQKKTGAILFLCLGVVKRWHHENVCVCV
jgi:hypothetical protein